MKKYIISVVVLFFSLGLFAQSQKSKWQLGGGIGMSAGNNSLAINVSPSLGYAVSNSLEVGVTGAYTYNSYRNSNYSVFSAGLYSNYWITPDFFARGHYENFTGKQKTNNIKQNFNEDALWLGAGYQRMMGNMTFQAGMTYNVLYKKDKSLFSSPIRPFVAVIFAI